MSDQAPETGSAGTAGARSTGTVVHTSAEVDAVMEALKTQGIADLDDLVAAMVAKAHEVGGEDDAPDTVDILIHEHYVLYHDNIAVAESEVITG